MSVSYTHLDVYKRQAVSIFGKVLVTRSIEDIDFIIVIVELHYGSALFPAGGRGGAAGNGP